MRNHKDWCYSRTTTFSLIMVAFLVGLLVGVIPILAQQHGEESSCMEYVTYEEKDGKIIETKLPERNMYCENH